MTQILRYIRKVCLGRNLWIEPCVSNSSQKSLTKICCEYYLLLKTVKFNISYAIIQCKYCFKPCLIINKPIVLCNRLDSELRRWIGVDLESENLTQQTESEVKSLGELLLPFPATKQPFHKLKPKRKQQL